MTATNRPAIRPLRSAFDVAAETTRATLRSTTLVNSSKATELAAWRAGSRHCGQAPGPGRSETARPLLSTWYGLTQLGGELNPTAVNSPVISLIGRSPSPSITARSCGHSLRAVDAARRTCAGRWSLAAAGGPDDQPDPPVLGEQIVGHLDAEPLRRPLRQRHVEHPRHLLHAEGIEDRALDGHVNGGMEVIVQSELELRAQRRLVA